MREKILFMGAEANIILKNNSVIKSRVKKSYRLKDLDEKIRKSRTKSEARLLERASKIVSVPKLEKIDGKKYEIFMGFLKGKRLSEVLDGFPRMLQGKLAVKIGEGLAKLHDSGIIHGDFTTSNMIFNEKASDVFFVDFGLGFVSQKAEDKAVDLYLLKEALESRHFKNWVFLFQRVKEGYKISKNRHEVLERLKKVESRGRYKEKY